MNPPRSSPRGQLGHHTGSPAASTTTDDLRQLDDASAQVAAMFLDPVKGVSAPTKSSATYDTITASPAGGSRRIPEPHPRP